MSDPYAPDQPPTYGQQPDHGTTPGAQSYGNDPYAADPYGSGAGYAPGPQGVQPQAGYPQAGYQQAPYQGTPVMAPRTPEPLRSQITNSAIGVLVVGFLCGGTIPAILGIIALTQVDTNPQSAQTLNKVGWILCIVFAVLIIGMMLFSFVLPLIMTLVFGAAAVSTY